MKVQAKLFLGVMAIWMSCVDKVDLSLQANELPIIIEGMVTDQPGADTIKITQAFPVDGKFYPRKGVSGASVVIEDSNGTQFNLTAVQTGAPGYYITSGSFQGVVGRSYTLRVALPNGTTVESTPQRMLPAGAIDRIYFEYLTTKNAETGVDEPGFNIFIDGTVDPSSSRRMRWKYNGVYKIFTNPAAITYMIPCAAPPCPIVTLACAEGCECCTCYVYEREQSPIVTNPTFLGASEFTRVFMHYLPINNFTFNERYRVEITQMELSQEVFDFYSAVTKQMENASSLFQPPFFELKGNMHSIAGNASVVGVFSASALVKKHIYINRSDIPVFFSASEILGDCRAVVANSTTEIPPFWE